DTPLCYCSAIMSANCSGKRSVWSRGRCPRTPGVYQAWGIALDIRVNGGWGGLRASPDGYPSPPHPVIPRRVALQRCALPFGRTALRVPYAAASVQRGAANPGQRAILVAWPPPSDQPVLVAELPCELASGAGLRRRGPADRGWGACQGTGRYPLRARHGR